VLRWFAGVSDRLGVWGAMSAGDTVEAFANSTIRETDFTYEAEASEAMRQHARVGVTAPRVRRDLTTRRVLTTEWVQGVSLLKIIDRVSAQDWDGVRRLLPGIDYHTLVDRYLDECLWELFGSGLFHGDPHPGNVLIARDGTIYLVDFGIVGLLSRDELIAFKGFFESLAVGDLERCYHYYRTLSPPSAATDIVRYRRSLIEIVHEWHLAATHRRLPAADRHSGRFMGKVAELMRQNAVRWEPDHQLFWRCMLALHAVQLQLAPELDLFDAFRRTFDRLRADQLRQLGGAVTDLTMWANLDSGITAVARFAIAAVKDGGGRNTAVLREGARRAIQAHGRSYEIVTLLSIPACIFVATSSESAVLTLIALILVLFGLSSILG
jgi:ubiquinone biosynthesis protein